jgi:uncharacterized protein
MNSAEVALEEKIKDGAEFQFVSGSRLYGTENLLSDWDIRGFVIPPFEHILGNKSFEVREFEGDHKIFSLKRFLQLALSGDPLISESFFLPDDKIMKKSAISDEIMALKDDIISDVIYRRIVGYSRNEWRKAMGVKRVSAKRTRTEDEVINDIRSVFGLNKEKMDLVIDTFYEDREVKEISSLAGIGGKRKQEVEKYGYCVSSASHSIRLLDQLQELMKTGKITFPRRNASVLKRVRSGGVSKEEAEEMHEEVLQKVEEAKKVSILPDKPNSKKVWKKYLKVISDYVISDDRFKEFCNLM